MKEDTKKGITIYNFLKTKEISRYDLRSNFRFVKSIGIDMQRHEGCPNCNDKDKLISYPSPAWTVVERCLSCETIMITYVADRMGGGDMDIVEVYEQKNK